MTPNGWTPKTLRIRHRKKQKEVASYLGISTQQYRRKETNLVRWYAHEFYLLAQLYDVDVNMFFEE